MRYNLPRARSDEGAGEWMGSPASSGMHAGKQGLLADGSSKSEGVM